MLDWFKKKDLSWVNIRASEDLQKLVELSKMNNKELLIISVDMQKYFLRKVFPKDKKEILIEYHKKIKKLSNLNKIQFLEVEYFKKGSLLSVNITDQNVLVDSNSLIIKKETDSFYNKNFINLYPDSNKYLIYVIGLNRQACVSISISHLLKKGYDVTTSFLGTASYLSNYTNYKEKTDVHDLNDSVHKWDLLSNKIEILSLKNDVNLLLKKGCKILDYYSKDDLGNVNGGLEK